MGAQLTCHIWPRPGLPRGWLDLPCLDISTSGEAAKCRVAASNSIIGGLFVFIPRFSKCTHLWVHLGCSGPVPSRDRRARRGGIAALCFTSCILPSGFSSMGPCTRRRQDCLGKNPEIGSYARLPEAPDVPKNEKNLSKLRYYVIFLKN